MYYIGICDDDQAFIDYIKRLFNEICNEITFYEYLSGEALVEDMLTRERYDLLILDIYMPGMDGNETARNFRKQFPDTTLVFCSGVCLPTVESFETTPYRYWLKEYTEQKMRNEVKDVFEKAEKSRMAPYIFGKKDNQIVKLSPKRISYISIAKKGSVIHCENITYTSVEKLSELYDRLKDYGFVYAHNSYIVNLKHIAAVSVTELELMHGEILTISRARGKEFQRAFAVEMTKKYK